MTLAAKLDDLGKPAWIALMVLGFVIWWPVGLATLAFLIWSGRMGCRHQSFSRWQSKMERFRDRMSPGGWGYAPQSGNHAFDEYRMETLRRLEEEQQEFRDFLTRLRMAKDKAEFDQFMTERRNRPQQDTGQPQA
jgi:hypothetical protein